MTLSCSKLNRKKLRLWFCSSPIAHTICFAQTQVWRQLSLNRFQDLPGLNIISTITTNRWQLPHPLSLNQEQIWMKSSTWHNFMGRSARLVDSSSGTLKNWFLKSYKKHFQISSRIMLKNRIMLKLIWFAWLHFLSTATLQASFILVFFRNDLRSLFCIATNFDPK